MISSKKALIFSCLKLLLALVILDAPVLQAKTPNTFRALRAEEQVGLFYSHGHQSSEAKKRNVSDAPPEIFSDLTFEFFKGFFWNPEISFVVHYKKCFTKKIKARSPPAFHLPSFV